MNLGSSGSSGGDSYHHPTRVNFGSRSNSLRNGSSSNGGGHTTSSSSASSGIDVKVARFCHECGNPFALPSIRFCCECGVKRLYC